MCRLAVAANRCQVLEVCREKTPELIPVKDEDRLVACHLVLISFAEAANFTAAAPSGQSAESLILMRLPSPAPS